MRKRPSATSASDPPKKNGEMGRILLAVYETLPLPQLREGGGNTPSQGDVIEAEIPDASGRPVGESLAGSTRSKSDGKIRNFRKSLLHGSCRYRAHGLRRSGSWNGEGPEGVHGSPLLTSGTWKVRRDQSCPSHWELDSCPRRSRSRSGRKEMTETGQRPEIAEAGPTLFGSIVGEGLGAQVATLASELGLDPPSRPMFERAKEPSLGKQKRRSQPSRRTCRTEWRRDGSHESNGEACATDGRVPNSSGNESATCFSSKRYFRSSIKRKAERGASASRAKAPRAEMDARSARREGTRIDSGCIGNGRVGLSAEERPGRESRRHGEEQPTKARPRGQENKESVLKSRNGSIQQHRRGPGERRRIQSEADRRHEAMSVASLRADNDAPPPWATGGGVRIGRRGAGERGCGCLPLDCSKTERREQARIQKHSRIAVFSRSRGSADAWSSGECRRRADPEIPRSRSIGSGGRRMVTRSSSRTAARCRSVDSVIWTPGTYVPSRARLSPIEPKPEDTESQRKAPGERTTPPSLEERSRRRTTQSRSPEDPGGRKIRGNGVPRNQEQRNQARRGKARAKESERNS